MDFDEKIKDLKNQQEQAKQIFMKCQGAIELLEGMKKEEDEDKDSLKKDNKK